MFSPILASRDWMLESLATLKRSHENDSRYQRLRAAAAGMELEASATARADRFWEQRISQEERAMQLPMYRVDAKHTSLPDKARPFGGGEAKDPHSQQLPSALLAMTAWDWKPGVGHRTVSLPKASVHCTRLPKTARPHWPPRRPLPPEAVRSPRPSPRGERDKSKLSLTHFGADAPSTLNRPQTARLSTTTTAFSRPQTVRLSTTSASSFPRPQTARPAFASPPSHLLQTPTRPMSPSVASKVVSQPLR